MLAHAMDRFGDAVYRTALSHTASAADAEDVFQDVFLRLYRAGKPFTDDEHLKAWLLRVTINRCRDLTRTAWSRKRSPYDTGSFKAIPDTHPDSAPDAQFASAGPDGFDALAAVASLPDALRETVHLFYVEECSTNEIARILDCEPATVRTRLHRARALLREMLDQVKRNDAGTTDVPPTEPIRTADRDHRATPRRSS